MSIDAHDRHTLLFLTETGLGPQVRKWTCLTRSALQGEVETPPRPPRPAQHCHARQRQPWQPSYKDRITLKRGNTDRYKSFESVEWAPLTLRHGVSMARANGGWARP